MENQISISTVVMIGVQVAFCGIALLALMIGLIFKDKFREDMLVGEGQASFLRVFTVKGAAVLVLAGLLLGGFLYPTYQLHLADELERKGKELKQALNRLDQISAVWQISGKLSPDELLGDSQVWIFSKPPDTANLQPDKSRTFNIAIKMEESGLYPIIWIQPVAKKFGKELKICELKKAGELDIDSLTKLITLKNPIVLSGGKYDFPNVQSQKPSKTDESVPPDFEKAALKPASWGKGEAQ